MARKKTRKQTPEDAINAIAEETSRELQRLADETDKELQKLISPLWDTAASSGAGEMLCTE